MANALQLNNSTACAGLGTWTYTVTAAGMYSCSFKAFIPYIPAGSSNLSSVTTGSSALSIVVNQDTGGGPVAKLTISSPSINQPIMGGKVTLSCAAGDVITVVLTSSAAADNTPNAIKTVINLFTGE